MVLEKKVRYPKIALGMVVVGILGLTALFVENVFLLAIYMAAYAILLVAIIWQYFKDPAKRGEYANMMLGLGQMAVASAFWMPRGIMKSILVIGGAVVLMWAAFSIVISQSNGEGNPSRRERSVSGATM